MTSKNTTKSQPAATLVELTAVQSASIDIDLELREVWVEADQLRTDLTPEQMEAVAFLMRCSYQRGETVGRGKGEVSGRSKGFDEGYEAALVEHPQI